ncbi:MAG: DUF2461 domain-containing protein [Spirochaetes bacterium]|jgi:uncharacterized protein (TIGR02453 family)|nr:DUF2461 domain-containing protein [Spirochaetota bacterium]
MINKDTLDFLKKLSKYNTREWFGKNRGLYEKAREDIYHVTMFLLGEIERFDPSVADVSPEDCLFRIYRDTRFSMDKSPYKTYFGIFMKRGGRKTAGAGYYLQVQPGSCFLGGGTYMPQSKELNMIRAAIARKHEEFRKILGKKGFASEYTSLDEARLKTYPKGYPKNHPAMDMLRYFSFTATKPVSDPELMSKSFPQTCIRSFKAIKPLNDFINSALIS